MVRNKKVMSAELTELNGITFKSKLEARVYKALLASGLPFSYELEPIVIMQGFYPTKNFYRKGGQRGSALVSLDKAKVRDITYTPDFVIDLPDGRCYIETKGFKTDSYNLKVKLFRQWLEGQEGNIVFAEIKTLKELDQLLSIINKH